MDSCNEGRKSPSDLKPSTRKRKLSSSSNLNSPSPSLQPLHPGVKKPKSVNSKILCTQCNGEFNEGEFRRHNKIEHNLSCSHQGCHLTFVDDLSRSHHLKSHQDQPQGKSGPAHVVCLKDGGVSNDDKSQQEDERGGGRKRSGASATRRSERRQSCSERSTVAEKVSPPASPGRGAGGQGRHSASSPPQSRKKTEKILQTSSRKNSSDELWTPQSTKKKRRSSAKKVDSPSPPPGPGPSAGRRRSLSGLSLLEAHEYWRCPQCGEILPSLSKLESHQQKPHEFQCQVEENCHQRFRTVSDRLKHHYEAHNVKKQLVRCPVCLEMVDSKSRKTHDLRSHELSCTVDGCPVQSNAEGIWLHRIKKHNYGRCVNQPGEDELDSCSESAGAAEEHLEASSLHHGETEDEEDTGVSPGLEVHIDVDSASKSESGLDVMEEHAENILTGGADLENEEDDEEAGGVIPPVAVSHGDDDEEVQAEAPAKSLLEMFPPPPFQRCSECEVLVPTRRFSRHCRRPHQFPCGEPQCSLHFTTVKDRHQHRLLAHDTREEVELAGYLVCPDCREVFSQKEQEQFSLHLKMRDHLTCSRCDRKFGSHHRDLHQFHQEYEHCQCDDRACHPPTDCRLNNFLKFLISEESDLAVMTEDVTEPPKDNLDNSVDELFHSEASPPALASKLNTEVQHPVHGVPEESDGLVLGESKTEVGDISGATVQEESVQTEVSLDENLKLDSLDSLSLNEAGQKLKSIQNEKIIKLNKTERRYETSGASRPLISTRPIKKRNKKLLEGNWKFVKSPKEDEYNANNKENEEGKRDVVVGENIDKSSIEEPLASEEIPVETVMNQDRNQIIVTDVESKALQGEERSEAVVQDVQSNENFDDIDALLGDSSDEEEAKQKTSTSGKAEFPVVVIETPRKSFSCPKCQLDFKKEKEFAIHLSSRHPFKCEFCPLQFNFSNGLSDHVNKEHQEETFRCLGSGSRSQSLPSCELCRRPFTREKTLLAHLKMDHDYPCPECPLKFTGQVSLKEHLLESHQIKPTSVRKSRRCSSEKSRKRKKNDRSSKREKSKSKRVVKFVEDKSSGEDDDSVCANCNKLFLGTAAFEEHINLDHLHRCPDKMCELSFTTESWLQLHLFEVHGLGTKPAPVEAASTIYNTQEEPPQQEKQDHDKLHYTPEKLLSSGSRPVKKKSRRSKPRFGCWKCKMEFSSAEARSQHTAEVHAFRCESQGCRHAYISQAELARHITRRHPGVLCSDCGAKFPDLQALTDHQLQPHGFTCHVSACSSKFQTKSKLVQHLQSQHAIKEFKIDDQNSGYITTERSRDNVQIAEWALDWIR